MNLSRYQWAQGRAQPFVDAVSLIAMFAEQCSTVIVGKDIWGYDAWVYNNAGFLQQQSGGGSITFS
jgi:hypothetical protein